MPVKIFTDSLHKIAYSTDASVYREVPAGVAFPDTVDEIKHHLDEARLRHTHIIPRAGGTSLAGQVVGEGIVADISRHWCHILEINAQERWARVEPGVVRDELNRALKPLGLGKCSAANECVNGSQRRYPFAARKRRGLAYDVELGLERSAYPNVLEHQERAEAVGCRREQTAMPDTFSSATECRTVQPAATIDER